MISKEHKKKGISFFFYDIPKLHIKRSILKEVIKRIIEDGKYECGEINIVFCRDEYLFKINKEFLKHKNFTDIITFNYSNDNCIEGELYISIERVRENAKIYDQRTEDEIARVVFHGILHLTGFNDKNKNDIQQIRNREQFYLSMYDMIKKENVSGL
jgi:probable rRNA maturation factor